MIDAIVLAGGRSSRLGAVQKAGLRYGDRTLLQHAIASVSFARHTVVVGDVTVALPSTILIAREDPPFGGPAAGVAAGLIALDGATTQPSEFTFVIACDMPLASAATAVLKSALEQGVDTDGLIAADTDEQRQPLAAVYRTASLASAVSEQQRAGRLDGLSMFRLIANLSLTQVAVPAGSTDDIDTWQAAARFEIFPPPTKERND